MLKYLIISMSIFNGLLQAENVQTLDKLKAEKEALILKLEAYELKKKIIQMENFIAQDKLKKEKKNERRKALLQLKKDLRADRNRAKRVSLRYMGTNH